MQNEINDNDISESNSILSEDPLQNEEKMNLYSKNEVEIMEEKTNNKINTIEFFISEFGFMIPFVLIIIILSLNPDYHSEKIFTSKISNQIFNSNYNPKIFIHVTDIHCTLIKSQRLDGSTVLLNSLYEYKPDLFLLTGDYVDNYQKPMRLGGQVEIEWKIFNTSIRTPMSKFKVIDIAGNHDLWGVSSPTSENNYFLRNSFIYNKSNVHDEDDFFLRKIKMEGKTFLLLNDFRFPVIRPPYGLEVHTTVHQLDLLENMIDNLEEEECYILSHYPVDRTILIKSSKGHSFEEIISKKKVGFLFTGHEHPPKTITIHHSSQGGLEFVTPAAFDKRAGLITIDNDNLIYHEVYIPYYGAKPLFFLTYPVPNEQISSHHIFHLNKFEIRLISYATESNIIIKIEGDIEGQFNYVKQLDNEAFLYSYPVELHDGIYKIHIYDENGLSCNINTEFTVGQKYKGKKELYSTKVKFFLGIRFLLIPFWFIILLIIFPFYQDKNLDVIKDIELYFEGKHEIVLNKFLLYLYLIVLSPLILRYRFQKITNILKYSIIICFIYPLILPIHFMSRFEGIICYTFFIFVVIGNKKIVYESWALQFTLIYYLFIINPWMIFSSGKAYYKNYSRIIKIVNSIICILGFIIVLLVNFILINQSLAFVLLFFTTSYIIIPLALLIIFIKFFKSE